MSNLVLAAEFAYKTLSLFGGSSLGIAYSLGIADLILAPAMPSVTARSGGIILPISKSIDQVLDSEPGPKQKRLGEFLIVKYNDGVVKRMKDGKFERNSIGQPAGVIRPGYPKEFLEEYVKQTGDRYKNAGIIQCKSLMKMIGNLNLFAYICVL